MTDDRPHQHHEPHVGQIRDYDNGDDTAGVCTLLKPNDEGSWSVLVCSFEPGVAPRVEHGIPLNADGGGRTFR
jgi:hypothetical protein